MNLFGFNVGRKKSETDTRETHEYAESNIVEAEEGETQSSHNRSVMNYVGDLVDSVFNGDKFPGSFGDTKNYYVDYYTLRKRSMQLFKDNAYARGLIRRLLRNEINTGLTLEASPLSSILPITEDEANEWAEKSEVNWRIWSETKTICDHTQKNTLGKLAELARQTALISGDCLVVLRINEESGLPTVQLIDGSNISTPFGMMLAENGNRIIHGVEIDNNNRHVAFYVRLNQGGVFRHVRIPAYGEKSGRRISWLMYGSDYRLDDVRGEPILALFFYMIKELDRYRDAELRAATINAMIPLFVKKAEKTPGSRPMGRGAITREEVPIEIEGTSTTRTFQSNLPGTVADELAYGEEIISFQTNRPNVNLAKFEEGILNAISWALEVPPEIARMLFQNNFSASRQANNEFNVYLQYRYKAFGDEFYQPIYEELLISSVLNGWIDTPGFLEAYNSPTGWRTIFAWSNSFWSGLSRPSVDIKKDVAAAAQGLKAGVGNYDFWNRRIVGKGFRDVMRARAKEQKELELLGLSFSSEENNNGEPLISESEGVEEQEIPEE